MRKGRPSGDVNSDVQKILKETVLPPGYRFDVGGQAQMMQESFAALMAAVGLAVIFIYLILASQFASFTQPVVIMMSLPFTLIGVSLALLATGSTLNMFSMIGFVMLMGLVTKNGILLVDFANRARRAGASLHDSLLQSGQVRLRPILMTTAAMIGGMTPLALGLGEGGETQAPMGRAIIGGVITSRCSRWWWCRFSTRTSTSCMNGARRGRPGRRPHMAWRCRLPVRRRTEGVADSRERMRRVDVR
jgi:multidrug efflux pump subunit AcrB